MSNEIKLSDRWIHAEEEILHRQADRLNFGDVSSWARGNPWFRHPNDVAMPKRISHPVHNLAELRKPKAVAAATKAETVVCLGLMPSSDKRDAEGERIECCKVSSDIAFRLDKFFASRVRTPKKAK